MMGKGKKIPPQHISIPHALPPKSTKPWAHSQAKKSLSVRKHSFLGIKLICRKQHASVLKQPACSLFQFMGQRSRLQVHTLTTLQCVSMERSTFSFSHSYIVCCGDKTAFKMLCHVHFPPGTDRKFLVNGNTVRIH